MNDTRLSSSAFPKSPCWDGVLLGTLYFLSGAVSLAYEVSWNRQIGLFFGHSANAAAIVLGSYFAGLGLGYRLGGIWSRKISPLKGYALAEIFAAGWALAIPRLLNLIEQSSTIASLSSSNPGIQTALRGLFCFALLLPATVALGSTLPFMAESLRGQISGLAGWSSVCYGLNTLGAFVGVAMTSLYLLLAVGVRGSSDLAAGLGALIGLVALWVYRSRKKSEDTIIESDDRPMQNGVGLSVFAIAFLSGFGILALEVLYTRLFSLVFHNSSYTFGEVIASVLLSLGMAALSIPLIARRISPQNLLAASAWLGSILIPVSVIVFVRRTGLDYFPLTGQFGSYLRESFLLTLIVVFPPVLVLGLLLPALWKSLKINQLTGNVLGRITMVNSLAAAAGSIAASFWMLPIFGLWRSFACLSCLFLVLSLSICVQRKRWKGMITAASTGLPLLCLIWFGDDHWTQPGSSDEVIVKRWESAYGWIDVVRDVQTSSLKVRQNLHYRHGSTGSSELRELRQSRLPLLLHQKPREVLCLGMGTGISAAGVLDFESVRQITIAELIPEVVSAARMLGESNQYVLDDPRVSVRIDDARHFLLASDREYDVIISDLFVPWESQTGYLYTVEHYRTALSRLQPGGIFCQWLPLYQLGPREFELIANSFAQVFPETTLWWGYLSREKPMLALIGTTTPLIIDAEHMRDRIETLFRRTELTDSYLSSTDHIRELALGRWPRSEAAELNTDEYPRVEFLAPVSHLNRETLSRKNLRIYFDRVLAKLPPVFESSVNVPAAQQRVILFGE